MAHSRRTPLLILALIAILGINAWLFVPRFLGEKQQISPDDLHAHQITLQRVAGQGATLASNPRRDAGTAQEREQLLHEAESVIADLQITPFATSLKTDVADTLKLAQVIAFTLRDLDAQGQDMKSAKIAMIFRQAEASAAALAPDDQANAAP